MYGEEDVDPEDGAAVMSDKITYSFDDMLSQVQVHKHGLLSYFAHAFLNKLVCGQSCLWVCVLSVCLSSWLSVSSNGTILRLSLPIRAPTTYIQNRLMASLMQRPVRIHCD